jgi:hypothetical protein
MGIIRYIYCVFLATLVGLTLVAFGDGKDTTSTFVSDPFSGYWNRFGATIHDGHPSLHHRVECEPQFSGQYDTEQACFYGNLDVGGGDWSVDLYQGDGTGVRFKQYSNGVWFTAKVWAIQPTCGAGASAGGWTVFVDLLIPGYWEGWVSYGHLESVFVSPGQNISADQYIGMTKLWPQTSCYDVAGNDGVHTHIEMYNSSKYACYYNWAPVDVNGPLLSYGQILGNVGRTIYTGVQQACS